MKGILKFVTSAVVILFTLGCLLIIAGELKMLTHLIPAWFSATSPIHTVVKTIGGALIGSGVFTAIIKSKAYTEVFSSVISEIIWSKKYIQQRQDKKAIWRMVSRLIYNEKFPSISEELEDIIANKYFPVTQHFYVENYEMTINMTDNTNNNAFWDQTETMAFTVKPTGADKELEYKISSGIDLPDPSIQNDLTDYQLEILTVNNVKINPQNSTNTVGKIRKDVSAFTLQHSSDYHVFMKRKKVVCKKTNPDKRFFANKIIKGLKISLIMDINSNVDFHRLGTINDYTQEPDHINGSIIIKSWKYDGIILPEQGYLIIFKV